MHDHGGDGAGSVLAAVERAASEHFGSEPDRASVSFVGVEPIEVLRFADGPDADAVSLLTLGMSRRPMGDAADAASSGPRAELIARVRLGSVEGSDLWRRLALLAAAPVVEGVVYAPGMTVDLGVALVARSRCTGGIIETFEMAPVATPQGEVTVLRFVPATSTELAHCRVHGSAALLQRWQDSGTDLLDLARPPVALS